MNAELCGSPAASGKSSSRRPRSANRVGRSASSGCEGKARKTSSSSPSSKPRARKPSKRGRSSQGSAFEQPKSKCRPSDQAANSSFGDSQLLSSSANSNQASVSETDSEQPSTSAAARKHDDQLVRNHGRIDVCRFPDQIAPESNSLGSDRQPLEHRNIEGTLRVWNKYSTALLKMAQKRKSLFENCPMNVEEGKRFTPLEMIDWHTIRLMYTCKSENVMGSHPSHNFNLHQGSLIDLNICDRFLPVQQAQAALAASEFYLTVLGIKMMTTVEENSVKIRMISTTAKSVTEEFGALDLPAKGKIDKSFRFGQDVTEDYLALLKSLCTASYGDQKTSYQFTPSENELIPLSIIDTNMFDYLFTVEAIVDSVYDKVELSIVEDDNWIPASFHSYPYDNGNVDYTQIPNAANWQNLIERCSYRLSLIRDDTENCHLIYLADKNFVKNRQRNAFNAMVNNFANKYIHFCLARTEITNDKLNRILKYSSCVDYGYIALRRESFIKTVKFSSLYSLNDFVLYETRVHGQTETPDSGIEVSSPPVKIKSELYKLTPKVKTPDEVQQIESIKTMLKEPTAAPPPPPPYEAAIAMKPTSPLPLSDEIIDDAINAGTSWIDLTEPLTPDDSLREPEPVPVVVVSPETTTPPLGRQSSFYQPPPPPQPAQNFIPSVPTNITLFDNMFNSKK
ncbi:Oidioi.mRNA.OKI2018_I69.XSR.g14649.t1.cds [Oikopleura dioica]|uniref:Oidioi.mRNA.OKI2018_I69.XSR.g14649.t1.cds n=1 Tax=Oikopleura dioica TaxID=34765 RepID=A0ABN7SAF2_OIKDI|nr:Oidioi.mRNA.OKI2018_I69.XSR.g14649.t1.cds [Oikopleura dioica]